MIDRSVPPKISDEISFNLPPLQSFALSNGLSVHFSEKNSLPIVVLNFILKRGGAYDEAGKAGLANLTGMTLDEGAHGYDALAIDEMFEALGSIFNITVEHDAIFLSLVSLKKNLEKSLEIISWILREPNFAEADFQREKQKLLSEIIRLRDEPSFVADWAFDYFLLQNTPYRYPTIGLSETIKSITREDVQTFYGKHFAPQNFAVTAVGNLSKTEFGELLEKYFGDWTNAAFEQTVKAKPDFAEPKFILINKKEAAQSEIRIGNIASPRNTDDYFAKKIVNAILGGQFSSRLNHNLREEKGITYGVRTNFVHNVNFGFFEASAAVDTANTETALREFSKEFDLIRKEISDDEIAFAKSYLKKTFPAQFETYSKIVSNISTQIVFGLKDDFFATYPKNLDACTREEIFAAAQKNIKPDEQLTVVVGDAEALREIPEKLFGNVSREIIETENLGM